MGTQNALLDLGFKPIDVSVNPMVLLFEPQQTSGQQWSNPEPRVIILATWLGGATSTRVAIYCRGYQQLYPSTPILLIRTVLADITIKSFAAVQADLVPARKYLLSLFSRPFLRDYSITGDKGTALLHIFSHGGCNSAIQLSRLLRENVSDQFLPIPLLGVIFDCCPGTDGFRKAYEAAAYSLPKYYPTNVMGRILLYPFIGAISTLQATGLASSIAQLREELNDIRTFGRVPRLYLHSSEDLVVAPSDVISHAEAFQTQNDVGVQRVLWDKAMHCALPAEDAVRYWRVIQAFVTQQYQTPRPML